MKELFDNLMALQDPNDISKFFYKDVVTQPGTKCRIFSYNYAAYSDWLLPGALESRGIMFELDANDQPVRVMARPMEKFFNLEENPFTMDLDLSQLEYAMTKADGSLISTYVDQGYLYTKSKGSISSSQAIESKQLLLDINYKPLAERALELAKDGFTCNFEYVAPNNRIVLNYAKKDLILLNVRHNETGEYVPMAELQKDPVLRNYLIDVYPPREDIDANEMIKEIREMVDIEGFVFQHASGLKFKLKTEWYSNLHRVKDTLNNSEALFMVVVAGGSDDMKSLFTDDLSRTKIESFETAFLDYLKKTSNFVFDLQRQLIGSDRKTYAIECQTILRNTDQLELFGVMMELYKGADQEQTIKNINVVFMKNYKKYVPAGFETLKNEY
jgi:T4 RnlA family RNA ligase